MHALAHVRPAEQLQPLPDRVNGAAVEQLVGGRTDNGLVRKPQKTVRIARRRQHHEIAGQNQDAAEGLHLPQNMNGLASAIGEIDRRRCAQHSPARGVLKTTPAGP